MHHVSLYAADRRWVSARRQPDGGIRITGQDLNPGPYGNEYEYAITIDGDDVPQLVTALQGDFRGEVSHTIDVIAMLDIVKEPFMSEGDSGYLKRHGIPFDFWSRIGD